METSIGAGDFKAKCLQLLDSVAETRQELVITKRGKPVAKVVPIPPEKSLFGVMAGTVITEGDIVSPIPNAWEASR